MRDQGRSIVFFVGVFLAALATAQAQAVQLIHSNDVFGEIEPCGCRNNPLGGMARKGNWLKKMGDDPIIQVDAGDLLFSSEVLPDLLFKQSELQAGYLLRSMDELGHDAVVPGEKDFALGVKTFDVLRKKSRIHFLAANLTHKGKIYLEKSLILTRNGADGKPLKVAVIGIVGEGLAYPKELKITPSVAAARREVQAVRAKVDLVVLLTHQGFEKDKALAAAVPGIDIIVGGHSQSFLQEPFKQGKTTIYQSSFRNQYVGAIPLQKPFTGEGYKLVGLDPGFDSPAETPSKLDELTREFKKSIAELNSKEEELRAHAFVPRDSATKYHTFPKCAECHLKQFDFWRKTQHTLALTTLVDKEQEKNKECLTCHTVGLGDPQGFSAVAHFAEFRKLAETTKEDEEAQFNRREAPIEPLPTADFAKYLKSIHSARSIESEVKLVQKDPQGQSIRRTLSSLTRAWSPVQCENCHRPGQDHPFGGTYSKTVETSTCLKCHTAERAPQWYTKAGLLDDDKVKAKRALVSCPAGDLQDD